MPRTVASSLPPDISSSLSHLSSAHRKPSTAHNPKTDSTHPSRNRAFSGESSKQPHPTTETLERSESPEISETSQPTESSSESWYEVRDIIDEKKRGRRLYYLVDWEDHKITGETYAPTWTPAEDVNEEAIGPWEEIKRARQAKSAKIVKTKKSAKPAKPAKPPANRKKDSQSSYSLSAAASQESRPLTPPEASVEDTPEGSSRPKPKKRKRPRLVVDDSDASASSDSDGDIENNAVPTSRSSKRPRIANHSQTQSQSQSQSLSLLSSPPTSRPPSVDSDDRSVGEQPLDEADQDRDELAISVAAIVDSVEISPGAEFDPNEYARLSQYPPQSQSQSQQTLEITPASPQVSARTIPDSQPDSALFLSVSDNSQPLVPQFDDDDDDDTENNALEGLPSAQPAQEQAPEPAATQEAGLRESANWAFAAGSTAIESESAPASGSRVNFQTQPEPDFSLLSSQSQNLHQTPLAAHTPGSTGPSNISNSVVPDSTRPVRNCTRNSIEDINTSSSQGLLLSSAQIVPALHSNEDLLGRSLPHTTPSRSQSCQSSQPPQPPQPPQAPQPPQDPSASQKVKMDGNDPAGDEDRLMRALCNVIGDSVEFADASLPDPSQGFPPPMTQEEANLVTAAALAAVTSAPPLSSASPAMLMATSTAMSMAPNDPIVPLISDPAQSTPDSMFMAPLVIGGSALQDLSGVHSGTIAPPDLSFSDPMVSGALEVSPEPEDHSSPQPMHDDDNDSNHDNENNDGNEDDSEDELDLSNPNYTTHEYVVTLPLASNTRQHYLDMIAEKKTEETIQQFSNVFSRDIAEVPDAETVARVDELLRKFIDVSDLPTFHDSTPGLSEEERMKQAVNTNSKYSFVYEFLERISTLKKTVLILAGRNVVLDYIEAIVNTAGISSERITGADSSGQTEKKTHFGTLSVLLGNASDLTVDSLPSTDIDIVIGFDHVARTKGLLDHYIKLSTTTSARASATATATADKTSSGGLPKPIILLLVSAFTVEHADLRLELTSVDDLERKNALLLCALECVQYLGEYVDSNLPTAPHDAAKAFGQMVTNPAIELEWQPQPLPEDVFDIYIQSSGTAQPTFTQAESIGQNQPLHSRKRQLDDNTDDDNGDKSKRVRLSAPIVEDQPPISDTVKRALDGPLWAPGPDNGPTVQISLDQLEALAAKVTSLQDRLQEKETSENVLTERVDSLDKLSKSNAKTIRKCQERLIEATKDRGVFQAERDKATTALTTTQERLASRTEALAEVRAQKTDLETRLAETNKLLAGSAQPDVAEIGTLRTELATAKERIALLERKVANADQDLDHARHAYQDASNAAADLSTENRDLSARVKELERRASDNLRQIHEAHLRSEAESYRAQWSEAVTMLKERQSELEWTREELRVLKNGRRETRQQSVPRSPRLSVISPRTVAGRGGSSSGNGNGNGAGGSSSSTGTGTPAPGGAGYAVAARQSVSRGNSPVSANFDPSVYSSPLAAAADSNNNGNGNSGGGGPPVPGMTYFAPSHRSGRMGHLRE